MKKYLLLLSVFLFTSNLAAAENNGKIVASIKPLHSLVVNVTGADEKVELLVDGKASPHDFQFKPSQMELLNNSEIVFYIDDSIEGFLKKPVSQLPAGTTVVKLSDMPGLQLLDVRKTSRSHSHDDGEEGGHHHHATQDMHFWLSPKIAIEMVTTITEELGKKYPNNANKYKLNSIRTIKKLRELDSEINKNLRSGLKPFLVFHDAFQYFENEYSLKAEGYISIDPTQTPSMQHMKEIRRIIDDNNITCIFTEPQFANGSKIVNNLTEGKNITIAELDENGANIKAGSAMYFQLLKQNIENYSKCKAE
jgi:zinc transport system substrate-binding protein